MKLEAGALYETACYIEDNLVGWWWAVRLYPHTFEIAVGPDLSASAFDRQFMKTPEGEEGFWHTWDNATEFKDAARDLVGIVRDKLRQFEPERGQYAPILEAPKPVRRSDHPGGVCGTYLASAMRNITTLSQKVTIQQVMVKSGWRSAEASIRTPNTSWDAELDTPEATIGNALTTPSPQHSYPRYKSSMSTVCVKTTG